MRSLYVAVQRLELLVTAMLARSRQPPTGVAGAVPATFVAELITLPSGLLAAVCNAIVKLAVCAHRLIAAVHDSAGCARTAKSKKQTHRHKQTTRISQRKRSRVCRR
jgi:hypothetical protein